MSLLRNSLAASLLLLGISPGHAVPVVSVDTDPATAGVQSVLSVIDGEAFAVDIVVEGVEATAPLNAFEFDLFFDPAVLTATGITGGGFLLEPSVVAESVTDNSTGLAAFTAATLLPSGASGDGVLATVAFEAIAVGSSALDLENVLLSAPFGEPIVFETVVDGSVTVDADGAEVAAPALPLLFVGGALALIMQRRRQPKAAV